MVVRYAGETPKVALVDNDGLPETLAVGGMERLDVNGTIDRIAEDVELVPMDEDEAEQKLETGEVLAAIVIPTASRASFAAWYSGPCSQPAHKGASAATVRQRIEALVYSLNQDLQQAYIRSNLEQINLLVEGGSGSFLGEDFTVIGLDGQTSGSGGRAGPPDPVVAERRGARGCSSARCESRSTELATHLIDREPDRVEDGFGPGRVALLSTQVQRVRARAHDHVRRHPARRRDARGGA